MHEMNAPVESAWNHRWIAKERTLQLADTSLLFICVARRQPCILNHSSALDRFHWCSQHRSAQTVRLAGHSSATKRLPSFYSITSWHNLAAAILNGHNPVGSPLKPEDSECSRVNCRVEQPQPTKGDLRSPQSPAIRFSTRQRCDTTLRAR